MKPTFRWLFEFVKIIKEPYIYNYTVNEEYIMNTAKGTILYLLNKILNYINRIIFKILLNTFNKHINEFFK